MNMQQLREAFAAWRKAQTGQAVLAYNLVWLLTDPTPITEEGLRELGAAESFTQSRLAGGQRLVSHRQIRLTSTAAKTRT